MSTTRADKVTLRPREQLGSAPSWGKLCRLIACSFLLLLVACGTSSGDQNRNCAGEFRCNPNAPEQLEYCDPKHPTGWSYYATCGSEALCDEERGQCRVCEPGSHRCDAWRLQVCASDGDSWQHQANCESAEFCNSETGQCTECLPGSGYCSDATLFACKLDQTGFSEQDCGSPNNCSATSLSCRPCFEGEYQCNLEELQVCNASKEWDVVDTCETRQLCNLTQEKLLAEPDSEPTCLPPVCEEGTYKCDENDGRKRLGCPPSRAEWQLLSVCDTPALCQQAEGDTCPPGQCLPGDYRCAGATLESCSSSGADWDTLETCASEDECNVKARDCLPCTPGDAQCNGPLLQDCNEEQKWVTRETCASAQLCNAQDDGGSCEPAQCAQPGEQYRCELADLQVCTAGLVFATSETCQTPELCNATDGRCIAPGCATAGYHRCQNNVLEVCPESLTGWSTVETCATGSVCDLELLGCADKCPSVEFRCNGTLPERCVENDDGSIAWVPVAAPCATQALCSADASGASCTPPACGGSLKDFECFNGDVHQCNAGRTDFVLFKDCKGSEGCDPGVNNDGPGQCDICWANDLLCVGQWLYQCDSQGQTKAAFQDCGVASRCVDQPDATPGWCLVCDSGEARCKGKTLEQCSSDRRSWTSKTCPFLCHDSGSSDYCGTCDPGSAECSTSNAAERRVCNASGQWGSFQACTTGLCAGGSCVECTAQDTSNCAGGEVCDASNQCVPCSSTDPCDSGLTCVNGSCQTSVCSDGATQCSGGTRQTCASNAWVSTPCQNPQPVCGPGGVCEACTSDMQCASGNICSQGSCVVAECTGTATQCVAATYQVCTAGRWTNDETCTGTTPACLQGTGCVPCVSDPDCGPPTPICESNSCVECASGAQQCGTSGHETCVGGAWTPAACTVGQVCDSTTGMCIDDVGSGGSGTP